MTVQQQVKTRKTTVLAIMSSREFEAGLNDARRGVPFNSHVDSWEYERGRLFACIAPLNMPLRIAGKLNLKAVALYAAAAQRKTLI
jgi:hypothetical protein